MAHPQGGRGNSFPTQHNFNEAYDYVGMDGVKFYSMTGEKIVAKRSMAKDNATRIIVFLGERSRHGSVCYACWGYRIDCCKSRILQCSETLDQSF